MMEHGRKFAAFIIGTALTMLLTLAAMVMTFVKPEIAAFMGALFPISIGAIAGMVATFITGNSVISFAYAKRDERSDVTEVSEERDTRVGFQPTP